MEFKKVTTAVFSALFIASVSAAPSPSEDVTATFQWVGTVPVVEPGNNWKIINTGVIDHSNGSMTFKPGATADHYEIIDSSELRFSVVDGGNADAVATSFDYTLTKLRFAAGGGFMSDVTPGSEEFAITADGTLLAVGSLINHASPNDISLKVTTPGETNAVNAGDEVVVQGVILVNNQL
ncbi:hypothetical protein [Vibrio atypicus]|uniref:hypothetical protein n=1 Tax=Vibrio atypicus TaxID=558271 RepID=UPI00135AA662|nr:hypothetical protein [Vibrio atypicus]